MRWTDEYLNAVAAQVRVRRCRDALTAELRDHLELQKADYVAAGLAEAEAEARAIADMGDPLLVGGALDAAHRPRTRWAGILAALAMLALGLLLPTLCAGRGTSHLDLLAALASGGALLLLACTDYTLWVKAALPWLSCGRRARGCGSTCSWATWRRCRHGCLRRSSPPC